MQPRAIAILPLALAGLALLPAAAPASTPGETLFKQRCQSCHSVEAGKVSPLGPNLRGVMGRKAGQTAFRYSPALKASNLTWTRENLDRYLSGPARMVPGTRMVVSITNPAQRAQMLDYLASQR